MRRLLATLIIPAAILLTSCGTDAPTEQNTTSTGVSSPPASTSATAAANPTDPAFVGGCSAVSVYIQQRVQSGRPSSDTAAADFTAIVEKDPSYQAMSESDKQLFRDGIEAGAAGTC